MMHHRHQRLHLCMCPECESLLKRSLPAGSLDFPALRSRSTKRPTSPTYFAHPRMESYLTALPASPQNGSNMSLAHRVNVESQVRHSFSALVLLPAQPQEPS